MKSILRLGAILQIFALGSLALAQSATAPTKGAGTDDYRPVLERYCITCHNQRLNTAGLSLDQADPRKVGEAAPVWEKVLRKLRTGQMPPAGAPRPDPATYQGMAGYLERELDQAAASQPNPGRVAAFHRLNRAEYGNVIRDVLAVDVDTESLLPLDDSGYGFDTVAEMLTVSPLLIERYLAASEEISRLAVGDPAAKPVLKSYKVPLRLIQDERVSEELPFGSRGGTVVRHNFPLSGEYTIRLRLQRNNIDYIRGLAEPNFIDVLVDGARVKLFRVGGEDHGNSGPLFTFTSPDSRGDPEREAYETLADSDLEVRVKVTGGVHKVGVSFLKDNSVKEGVRTPRLVLSELESYKGGIPALDSVTIGGPYNPVGMVEGPSRKKVFVCNPAPQATADGTQTACAERIIRNLAQQLFRRPITAQDVKQILPFYTLARADGTFDDGIRAALKRLLTSPEFLFRIERDPPRQAPGGSYQVSELELASRLSFFLWSSAPDAELLALAEKGRLRAAGMLKQQFNRMLSDSRAAALANNFAGQWLYLRNLASVAPDPNIYPDFDENLTRAFRQETLLLVKDMLQADRPITDLLRADYTFLNERLARHYEVAGVQGSQFRKVLLTDSNRRGLLGHGSILTVTSYANRTAPTIRGKWILENLLGTPPPPPPPNVPALKDDGGAKSQLTMRQRMEEHRGNPVCASCHAKMDPLGFALENFDGIGQWRSREGATAIDSSGTLIDGRKFSGPRELQDMLLANPEQFVQTVTEKLLIYALGRRLEYYDAPVVRRIVRNAASDYRWSAVLYGVVESAPFQMRRTAGAEKLALQKIEQTGMKESKP
ncbi:MAG: DUF1592 domain-containing protein [Acidobacteria bacterium]|nr:DUF1592 domain-containing protein [Acidobacteriota bacterium]